MDKGRNTNLELTANTDSLQTGYVQENLVSDWRDMGISHSKMDLKAPGLPELLISDASGSDQVQDGVKTEVNDYGDQMEINGDGQITKFTYAQSGETYEMKYDENGEVSELKCPNGDTYYKITDGFYAGTWGMRNDETGEEMRSGNDLGQITVDRNGIVVENQGGPILPERQ